MQLNPYYTWEYLYTLGQSYHWLADYDKAIEVLEEAQARNGNVVQVKLYLAACYVRVGRLEDAEWMIDQLQIISPATSLSTIDKTLSLSSSAARQTLLADLKRAGLPE
jgi:thioredoxin-like negative regulator of GroEL